VGFVFFHSRCSRQVWNLFCCNRRSASTVCSRSSSSPPQRYRCRGCHRTVNRLSGTPLARLRYKAHWLDYLGCMLDSRSD